LNRHLSFKKLACAGLLILAVSLPVGAAIFNTGDSCAYYLKDAGLPLYATEGDFRQAPERQGELKEVFRRWLKESQTATVGPKGPWRPVEARDFSFDFNRMSDSEKENLIRKGVKRSGGLAIFTSGAGLWSRGGGQVKALVPFNLTELCTPEQLSQLVHLGDVVKADSFKKVLELGGIVEPGESERAAVTRIRHQAEMGIESILSEVRLSPRAVNSLDIKFVNAALLSRASGSYVTLDVWTSQQTHGQIAQYIFHLEKNFRSKSFFDDPAMDSDVKSALSDYFNKSEELGETHLFGYQEGVQGLYAPNGALIPWEDPHAGEPAENTEYIGEGAGMLKAYMDKSGRTSRLRQLGKTDMIFENIEVQNNWALVYGAFAETGRNVGVVLVPQLAGESGGNGFMVMGPDGAEKMELHETAVMPESMRVGHSFFNTNTIIQSLNLSAPDSMDFEKKDGGLIYRPKVNAGDITKTEPPSVLGGRRPQEYVNQKSYQNIIADGAKVLEAAREHWMEIIKH